MLIMYSVYICTCMGYFLYNKFTAFAYNLTYILYILDIEMFCGMYVLCISTEYL